MSQSATAVTVVLDDIVVKKLHIIQSKKRKKEKRKRATCFSRVLNDQLRIALK